MMGTELDELGEFDAEFIDNISKFVIIEYASILVCTVYIKYDFVYSVI